MADKLLNKILKGYLGTARNLASVFVFILIAGLVCAGLIYPLWLFATTSPETYTLLCGILLAAALIIWMIFRFRHRQERNKQNFRGIINLIKILAVAGMIYLLIYFFGTGNFLIGSLLLILFFFTIGWLLYGSRDRQRKA